MKNKKDTIINEIYLLDLSGYIPVQVKVLDYFENNKIKC